MIAAVAAAAIAFVASLVLGSALLAVAGRERWSPLAGGVGLAVLLVVCGLGGRVVVCGVVVLGAATYLLAKNGGPVGAEGWRGAVGSERDVELVADTATKSTIAGLGAALIAAAGASIPFLINDRVGVLGAGLVNDDMANHLLMADWAQNETEPVPQLIEDGYPLGPHSIAATLSDLLGTGLVEAFAGLTIAIAAIFALTAAAALRDLPTGRRIVAGALAALPYLGAAYLVQGAFKEPLQALLLITFVLLLVGYLAPKVPGTVVPGTVVPLWRVGVPLGVVAAATIYNYSFPGLFWLAGATAFLLLFHKPRPAAMLAALRRLALPIAATVGVLALLTIPEWGRILTFTGFGAFDPAGEQTGLGNLRQAISPLEALGVWPSGEFRLAPADASLPAAAFYLAGLLGAFAVGFGVVRAIRRRREEPEAAALLAALAAATLIYAGAAIAGTPYTSAKALAIAAPVAMLLALRALLAKRERRTTNDERPATGARRATTLVLALTFTVAAALSTFLVLRQAPVAPADHGDELARIRPLVEGDDVLFLGRDDFIAWHLRGAPVSTHITNFFSTGSVPARVDPENGEKFDFDAVSAETLDRFDWVLATSSAYASQPPESFELVRRTPSYALWERTGRTIPRQILGEGAAPGALFKCDQKEAPSSSGVWPIPPIEGPESRWGKAATIAPGETATQEIRLTPARWEISLAYDSPRPLSIRVSGPGLSGSDLALPANLDFRGPTPPFPAEPPLDIHHRGAYELEVTLADAPLAGRLLGVEGEAHLRGLFATPVSAPVKRIAGARTCGEYVDWYR